MANDNEGNKQGGSLIRKWDGEVSKSLKFLGRNKWGAQSISANGNREENGRKNIIQKLFKNQRQPAAEIGVLLIENSIISYCFSQVLHFPTDSILYFAIFLSKYALNNIDR